MPASAAPGEPVRSRTISAFTVGDGLARDGSGLDLVAFSRFKHGAVAPAWQFAQQILDRLTTLAPDIAAADRLVVTASCYKYVPLASVTLSRALAHLLNRRRAADGQGSVTQTQLYRERLIEGDYSTMTLDQRRRFIEQDVIQVDADLVAGAPVLVVDDVRITGFHEGRIGHVLAAAGATEVIFAYWAVGDGRGDPTVERRMNQAAVGDLRSLEHLITAGGFALNSRVCKLILSASEDRLADFLSRLPLGVLVDLVAGMQSNGYAVMPTYRRAYELMRSALAARRRPVVA